MKVKNESEVALCPTLSNPIDCSLPDSSVHGICQARVLEWGAIAIVDVPMNHLQIILSYRFWLSMPQAGAEVLHDS